MSKGKVVCVLDGKQMVFRPFKSQCGNCEHFLDMGDCNCEAYPEGIPDALLTGEEKHSTVRKDQKGDIIYTPVVASRNL